MRISDWSSDVCSSDLKRFKPVTPGTRFRIGSDYSDITTNVPEKSLVAVKKRSGGRNHKGKMTMRYIGGGHKKKYRVIDFKRNKFDIPATENGRESGRERVCQYV